MSNRLNAAADQYGAVLDPGTDQAIVAGSAALADGQSAAEQDGEGAGRDAGGAVFEAWVEVVEVAAFEDVCICVACVDVQAVHAVFLAPLRDRFQVGRQRVQGGGVAHLHQQFRAADRGDLRCCDDGCRGNAEQACRKFGRECRLRGGLRRQADEQLFSLAGQGERLAVHGGLHRQWRVRAWLGEQPRGRSQRGVQAQGAARVRIVEVDDGGHAVFLRRIDPDAGGVVLAREGLACVGV